MKINAEKWIGRVVIAVACVLGYVVVYFVIAIQHIDDAYAQWGAVNMVTQYLNDHDDRWPNHWDDLEPYFESHSMVGGWTYAQFQDCVWIDFDVETEALRKQARASSTPPFDVIGARSWFAPEFGDGPNAMLHSYLRSDPNLTTLDIINKHGGDDGNDSGEPYVTFE